MIADTASSEIVEARLGLVNASLGRSTGDALLVAVGEQGDGALELLDAACAAVRPAKGAPNEVAIMSELPFTS